MCLPNDVPAAPRQSILGPGGPGNRRSGLAAWTVVAELGATELIQEGPICERAVMGGTGLDGSDPQTSVGDAKSKPHDDPNLGGVLDAPTSPPTPDYRRSGVRAA